MSYRARLSISDASDVVAKDLVLDFDLRQQPLQRIARVDDADRLLRRVQNRGALYVAHSHRQPDVMERVRLATADDIARHDHVDADRKRRPGGVAADLSD